MAGEGRGRQGMVRDGHLSAAAKGWLGTVGNSKDGRGQQGMAGDDRGLLEMAGDGRGW